MAQIILDLEQYFEKDIIEFLDQKKDVQEIKDKQSTPEMLEALNSSNIEQATKLLEDAINNYNKLPVNSADKESQFRKLCGIYNQAKDFLALHPAQNKLNITVELLKKSKQLDLGPIEKITALIQTPTPIEEIKIKKEEPRKDPTIELDEKIKNINSNISKNIIKKDLKLSVGYYKELKACFEQYPSTDAEKKQEVYQDLLSFFTQINKLKKELDEKKVETSVTQTAATPAQNIGNSPNLKNYDINKTVNDIKTIMLNIKNDMKNSDYDSASRKIIDLRQMTSNIPDQYKQIRAVLNSKIDAVVQKVEFIKRMKNHR